MADPTQPPPAYNPGHAQPSPYPVYQPGPLASAYPQPGATPGAQPIPQEAPPKYEPPKSGPYSEPPPQQPPYGFPPQQGYQQGPAVANTVVVQHVSHRWSASPMTVQCPNCQQTVMTTTSSTTGLITWLTAGLICFVGCWAGCCLIPFCIPELQDVEHKCPNCQKMLGVYQRVS